MKTNLCAISMLSDHCAYLYTCTLYCNKSIEYNNRKDGNSSYKSAVFLKSVEFYRFIVKGGFHWLLVAIDCVTE